MKICPCSQPGHTDGSRSPGRLRAPRRDARGGAGVSRPRSETGCSASAPNPARPSNDVHIGLKSSGFRAFRRAVTSRSGFPAPRSSEAKLPAPAQPCRFPRFFHSKESKRRKLTGNRPRAPKPPSASRPVPSSPTARLPAGVPSDPPPHPHPHPRGLPLCPPRVGREAAPPPGGGRDWGSAAAAILLFKSLPKADYG